jgi:hypothetical protein
MDLSARELLLHRIFSGIHVADIEGVDYIVKSPTKFDKYKASQVYIQSVYENRYNSWYTKKTVLGLLENEDIFLPKDEEKLEKMVKDLEELKLQLFQSLLNAEKMKFVRKSLDRVKTLISILTSAKHSLDYLTVEGFSSLQKSQYLVARTLFYENGERVFSDNYKTEDTDGMIEKVILHVGNHQADHLMLRELARTEPWRNYWGSNKQDIFGGPAIDLTDEQRSLILYSKMYDGAYEHPECPEDNVIEDDDLFDGWMIFEKRKREKAKTQKQVSNIVGAKQKNAEELFIPTPDQTHAQKIHNMNTLEGKVKRAQREKVISKVGKARDSQFPDRKQQIITQANREFAEKVR